MTFKLLLSILNLRPLYHGHTFSSTLKKVVPCCYHETTSR